MIILPIFLLRISMRIIILNVTLSKSNRTRLSKLAKYGFEMKLLRRDPNNEKNEKKGN